MTPPTATATLSDALSAALAGSGCGTMAHTHAASTTHVGNHVFRARLVTASFEISKTLLRVTTAHASAVHAAYGSATLNAATWLAFRAFSLNALQSFCVVKNFCTTRYGTTTDARNARHASPTTSTTPGTFSFSSSDAPTTCITFSTFIATTHGMIPPVTVLKRFASCVIIPGFGTTFCSARAEPKYSRELTLQNTSHPTCTAAFWVRNANTKGAAPTMGTPME